MKVSQSVRLERAFKRFDEDKNGWLDMDELKAAFAEVNDAPVDEATFVRSFNMIDKNHDGKSAQPGSDQIACNPHSDV